MATLEKLITADEFWLIAQLPENENKRLELIDGVIYEMAASSPANTVIAARFVRYIGSYVDDNDLGFVTGADGGYELDVHNVPQPDAAFISKVRQPTLPDKFRIAPDLVVEVISPSERPHKVLDKINRYLRAGTRLVWAVYPEDRVVHVYRMGEGSSANVKVVIADEALDGEDVLPGFTLPLSKIFGRLPDSHP